MSIAFLFFIFMLGCLVGALYANVRQTIRLEEQWVIKSWYDSLLWHQVSQIQSLLRTNKDSLTDNLDLRQKYMDLQHRYEKILATLN